MFLPCCCQPFLHVFNSLKTSTCHSSFTGVCNTYYNSFSNGSFGAIGPSSRVIVNRGNCSQTGGIRHAGGLDLFQSIIFILSDLCEMTCVTLYCTFDLEFKNSLKELYKIILSTARLFCLYLYQSATGIQ